MATVSDPVAVGTQTFKDVGCGNCHVSAAAGTAGKGFGKGESGPVLAEVLASDARTAGEPLPLFTYRSIVDANAYISPGYERNVMPQGNNYLRREQLAEIVAFLVDEAEHERPSRPFRAQGCGCVLGS